MTQPAPDPKDPSPSEPDLFSADPGEDDLLAALADDFAKRLRRGEHPQLESYVATHPDLADRIRNVLQAVVLMEKSRCHGPDGEMNPIGTTIGPYKLLEHIGEGGFGVVYMAEQQTPLRRRVAIKIVKPGMDSHQVLARFEAERQALAIMDHPHIAKVFDAGATHVGRPYFVMELVKGEPITAFCDRHQLTTRERLDLFTQVCLAVQHAHQKGIIHRDIKPANLLVALHDTTPVVKVIDFGVAKALGQKLTDKTLFTGFTQLLGTPLYMSPEQAGRSNLDIDTRSDIYSLGVLLYELLTGTTPFDKERLKNAAVDEICRIIREEEPPNPSTRLHESKDSLPSVSMLRRTEPAKLTKLVRGELDWIVMKALEKDRSRRYGTAMGLASDIQRYLLDEPIEACPPSSYYRLKKFARRNKSSLAVASVVLLTFGLLGIGIGWVVRDQIVRQARVTGQIELILSEVGELEAEQKWTEALAAARRAQSAGDIGVASPQVIQRVASVIRDLDFVERLEQIRLQRSIWINEEFDNVGADRNYDRAFRHYGVNVLEWPIQRSIDRLKVRPALAIPFTSALEDWAYSRPTEKQQPLLAVASGIDASPLRIRYRDGLSGDDDRLLRLAESIDMRSHRPSTLGFLAVDLLKSKHVEKGVRFLRDAQFAHPDDFWLCYSLGHALYERQDYASAVRFYTAAVSIRPQAVAALNNLGTVLQKQGQLSESMVCYQRAIELQPRFALAYSNLGNILYEQQKFDEAVAAYRKSIELDPEFAVATTNLGVVLASQGKLDEASAAYRHAIELDPNSATAFNNLGSFLCDDRKDYAGAMDVFRKALELDPKHVRAYAGLGTVFSRQRMWDEAMASYEQAVEIDPSFAPAHRGVGRVLSEQGKLDQAIESYQRAIELDPYFAPAFNSLGISLYQQEKIEEAAAAFRRAIELEPKNVLAYSNLGETLIKQGQLQQAVAAYSQAVELNPRHAEGFRLRAKAYADLDQWSDAAEDYQRLVQLNPRDHWPWYYRGCILAYLGRTQEYIDHCRAMHRQFNHVADYNTLERISKTALLMPDANGGPSQPAANWVEQAWRLDSGSVWSLQLRGLADYRAGRFQQAAESLEKCLNAPPADQVMAVTVGAILSLVRRQLGDREGANGALRRAEEEAHLALPDVGSDRWASVRIENWLIAQILLREAKAAVLDQAVPPTIPSSP